MPLRAAQRGFTLLEILIAIVIFSIGLLGIAGLQIAGMRFTHGSQLRSAAVLQAESMADLMRANAFAVRRGLYNAVNYPGGAMPDDFPTDCAASLCTAEDRAAYDLVTWNLSTDGLPREANEDVLPLGVGVVCRDSTPDDGDSADWACDDEGNVYAIKLEWQERSVDSDDAGGEDVTTQRFVMTVVPVLDEQ